LSFGPIREGFRFAVYGRSFFLFSLVMTALITKITAMMIYFSAFRTYNFQSIATLVAELGVLYIFRLAFWALHLLNP
jgi:hypothetical protein